MQGNLEILNTALGHFSDPASRDRYLDLYADEAILHGYQGVGPGKANIAAFYAAIWQAFPDARVRVLDTLEAEDKVVCRFEMHATQQGAFQGIPATGRAIVLPGITILRFAGGKCVERWSQADFLGLMAQLGALPA
ncbi:MAG: ester cyclase [Acidobacteria bacterium]|nr:ester cyclase [Acidobacteriota bacterium]